MLLAPPSQPPCRRDVAAAEVALALRLPWTARRLAAGVLAARPSDARALAVMAALGGNEHGTEAGVAAVTRTGLQIGMRITNAYRTAVAPDLTEEEARLAIEGIVRQGHTRAAASRRHRGEPLPTGSRIVVHHRRPRLAVVLRGARVISLRLDGRTILPAATSSRER